MVCAFVRSCPPPHIHSIYAGVNDNLTRVESKEKDEVSKRDALSEELNQCC